MDIAKLKELLGAARRAVDGLQYRGKSVNMTERDEARDEAFYDVDPAIADLELALPSLLARLEAAEKVAAEINDFIEQDAEVWVDTLDAWRSQLNPAYDQEKARG